MTLIRFSSPFSSTFPFRRWRFRFEDLWVRMWFMNALLRRIFPLAVLRKRLAALRLDFIFGM